PRRIERWNNEMMAQRNQLVVHARRFFERAAQIDVVDVDDDVLDAFWDLQQDWLARAQHSTRPDAARPAVHRLAEAVLKTAALFALDRDETLQPRVTMDDFAAARKIGGRWLADMVKVVEALGATSFQRDCDAVIGTVKQQPTGIKLSDL